MSRKVCFIDDNGQTATCIRDDENCEVCDHNDDTHKKWRAEIDEKFKTSHTVGEIKGKYTVDPDDDEESALTKGIVKHELGLQVDFIDQGIIICGSASTDGIQVFAVTACHDENNSLGCDYNCLDCPYVDKKKEVAIFNKWEDPLAEIMRDLYKKIEAMRNDK